MNKRSIHLLTDLWCRRVKKTGSYGDGDNLFLSVRPRASTGDVKKSWVYRYYRYGEDVRLGLGGYPAVSLSSAREITKKYNSMRAAEPPTDPREYRREEQQGRKDAANKTFAFCVEKHIELEREGWRNPKSEHQWKTILGEASKSFRHKPVSDITVDDVAEVLRERWNKTPETADRQLQRMHSVFSYAISQGWRVHANPADKNLLRYKLPKRKKRIEKHHSSLPYQQMPECFKYMRSRGSSNPKETILTLHAIELLILTGLRTSELVSGRWKHINFEQKLWVVPAVLTKAKKEPFEVPLSTGAMRVLKTLQSLRTTTNQNEFILTGGSTKFMDSKDSGGHLSTETMLNYVQGKSKSAEPWPFTDPKQNNSIITPHGFRSTLREWGVGTAGFPSYLMEKVLNHSLKDKVEAAYQRSQLTEQRAPIMEAWWEYCSSKVGKKENKVVPLKRRKR